MALPTITLTDYLFTDRELPDWPKAVLWTCDEDAETISPTDPEAALEDYIANASGAALGDVTITGYARLVLGPDEPALDPARIVEDALEALDPEYNCGEDATKPTPAMLDAACAFVAVMRAEYVPWNCEPCCQISVSADELRAWRDGLGAKESA